MEIRNSEDLLSLAREELSIPSARPGGAEGQSASATGAPATQEWRQLYRALNELEAGALDVGEIPRGYPLHVDWIMRLFHALLPWYTRPLRKHAEHTVAVCRSMREVLAGIIGAQQQLAERLEQLERRQSERGNPGAPGA